MITSLRNADLINGIQYFCFNDGEKNTYCDALTSAEAASKFILANHKIDMILAFGSKSSYDEGDDLRPIMLHEGSSFYAADVGQMSSFSLYRYRLAEFLDEVDAEFQDVRELLDDDQQAFAKKHIRRYFNEKVNTNGSIKFNRFFDRLVRDDELRSDMEKQLRISAAEAGADPDNYTEWIRNYLYREMRETSKMQLLEGNESAEIRFISPEEGDDSEKTFTELLMNSLEHIGRLNSKDADDVDIYLCIQNDNARDAFVLTSIIEVIKSLSRPGSHIARIVTADAPSGEMAETITDDTGKLAVNDLLSATKSFLRYGKTDMLLDFRESSGIHNPEVDSMIYAMRNIDIGVSLCDVTDIERGITRLREIFSTDHHVSGDSFVEKYFNVLAHGIRRDYGPLLSGESIEFIELVKWMYDKGFWQQTLTMIESRAPEDFVRKGIFYYCDSQDDRERVVEQFGKLYYDLKPFEKYKLDDVEHYFVKFYSRWRAPHPKDSREYQLEYAKLRLRELDTEDPDVIRAHTRCPDRDALKDLLFAYFYLGDVRNTLNHANDEFGGFVSIMDESDMSGRVNLITQAIDYFIHCYGIVTDLIPDADAPDEEAIIIETSELAAYAKSLRRQNHKESEASSTVRG